MVALTAEAPAAPGDDLRATIPGLLAARVAADPEGPAWWELTGGIWQATAWRAFDRRIAARAARLAADGIGPGHRVALIAPSCLDWEIANQAVLRLGAVTIGIDPHAAASDRDEIIRHSGAGACIVAHDALLADLSKAARAALRLVLPLRGTEAGDAPPPPARARADALATIVYTSGTTGTPKAIGFTHAQICGAVAATLDAFGPIGARDRAVCWLPLANMFQRMMNLCAIAAGAQTWFVEDPRRLMEALPGIRPTILIGVPRLYEKVERNVRARIAQGPLPARVLGGLVLARGTAEAASPLARRLADRLVLGRVRAAFGGQIRFHISGSAPLAPGVMRFFDACGLPVLEAYGLSECITPVAANRPGERRIGTVGRPLPGNAVKLAPDGEVLLRAPGLFTGYLDGAGEAAQFDADGFFATGDLGRFDDDGFLTLTGRKRDLIKTSTGRRIAPSRIEAALASIPDVELAAAIGDGHGEIVAVLALDPAAPPQAEAALAERLRAGIAAANGGLSSYEQVRGAVVVRRGFSIAEGHLTASLKLKRAAVIRSFAADIDRLYKLVEARPARLPLLFAA